MIHFVDSHCHLHDKDFFSEEEAEAVLEKCRAANVEKIICIGTSHADSMRAREFASSHDGVYWTYGVHPEEGDKTFVRDVEGAVAIGEVGLDYHSDGYDRAAQICLFEEMLQLATEHDLPVSFHVRNAFADFFPVVANFPSVHGVVHSFTDSKKNLRRILETSDFYVGVNGLATYSTLPLPPVERILLETDAPFLAPVPHRGEKNDPSMIPDVAHWLCTKVGLPLEEIATITTANAQKLFKI